MKKITLVLFFCFCAVGFGQTEISTMGDNSPVFYGPQQVNQQSTAINQSKNSDAVPMAAAALGKRNAVFNAVSKVKKQGLHTSRFSSPYSSWQEQSIAASQGKVTMELIEVKNERIYGPHSADQAARSLENRGQTTPSFRLNSEVEYIARTSTGEYTAPNSNTRMANLLTEEFDDITTLAGAGFTFVNASDVIGTTDWFQGNPTVFDSQAGAPEAYIAVNFNSTAGSTISNWMITPQLNLENGDEITFWTRTVTANTFPDRLEVRLSPDGTSTAPAGPADVGSYTELLLEINPTLATGGYPDVWTEFTVVVAGLTGATDTSVAFRYFVTDGGPTGSNSNYIGIDTLSIDEAAGPAPLALPLTFEGQTVVFNDFNGSATQVIANPDPTGVNTSANVAENFVPANAAFAGVNIVVPVDLTDDKMFSMDVWSPLANTPVLLKLEGGPNPPVEREVFMTTSGAWEELVFDFSSEGPITFDSVTVFMNFNVVDAANQTFYWDNLEQLPAGGGPSVMTYTDLASFQAACTGTLTMEDFSGGPGVIQGCGTVMSSAGDGCFAPGELEDGFDVQASNATDTVFIPIGALGGNTSNLVGASTFAEFTILNFTGPDDVFAVAMDIWNNLDPDTEYRVYDGGGALLDMFTLNNAVNTENFFGIVSTDAIGRIEIEGLNGSGELFGNLQFGDCGGGGMACNEQNPSNGFENGYFTSTGPTTATQVIAADLTVPADTNLSLTTINANLMVGAAATVASAEIIIYNDAGGFVDPGSVVTSFPAAVPTTQPMIGTAFGFDVLDVTFDIAPTALAGQAGVATTYWISIYITTSDGSDGLWEATSASIVGNVGNWSPDNGVTWNLLPDDLVYNFSGDCTPIGGGGGPTCFETNPGNAFETGFFNQVGGNFTNANDITVPVDEDFELTQMTLFLFADVGATIDEVNIFYYSNNGGIPGAMIGSEAAVAPTSQVVVGNNFGFDVSEVVLDVTPFMFEAIIEGQTTTYWIETTVTTSSGGISAWEGTTASIIGNPNVSFDNGAGVWLVNAGNDGVYTFAGDCTPHIFPTYDTCDGALPIFCGDTVNGDTLTATIDDAVAPTCDTTVTAPGVWYVYSDTSGLVTDITLTTCSPNTDYDTKISVYTGDCGAPPFTCVAGNDDDPNCAAFQSSVQFQSDGNTTFYILVHGFASGTGNFELNMSCTPVPPPNDMIANSIDVDEIGFPYTDPAVAMPAATAEAGTPANCNNAGSRGVWYNFIPTGDGTATASITNVPAPVARLIVNNGPLAGGYVAIPAAFGGALTTTGITQDTAVVIDDNSTGSTDPNDACDPVTNGASLAGKIAIARRGACEFGVKALAAQNAGAVAVIVVNNAAGDPIVMGGGAVGDQVTIPAVMVSDVDGEAIITQVSAGGTVNATLALLFQEFSSITFYTAPDENAVETDLVLVDWFENQCLPGTTASIPTVAGQAYYVYAVNHGGIADIQIDGTNLGLEDNLIEGFSYYPNPTDTTVTLTSVDIIDSAVIYNMLGQQVVSQKVDATTSVLDVSSLATGAYILKVSVNGQIGTYKILKR